MKASVVAIFDELVARYPALAVCRADIEKAAQIMIESFRSGKKLLTCGNGGSASDAEHIVGELMKAFVLPRKLDKELCDKLNDPYLSDNLQGALPAVSMIGESALSTAYANDCAPDLAFAQQVLGLGREGDVLLGISTSGNSKNVVYAGKVAAVQGMKVIMLTGEAGGKCAELADAAIRVPEKETFKVQEYHLPVYHALCLAIEEEFFGE
ncbi:MAG: SIS domain-containing protein [Clostridia bacterium]|nr:SIS domain-containing protein [Clostridia bacterium]